MEILIGRYGLIILVGAILLGLGLLPALIAYKRRHPQALAITALTIVGLVIWVGMIAVLMAQEMSTYTRWSPSHSAMMLLPACVPWVIALIWSCWARLPRSPPA
jgi:hypothetical protein